MSRFLKFCIAGTIAYFVDAGVLTALADGLGMNPYGARVISFVAAATTTWWLNRRYTFEVRRAATRSEWVGYVALMVLGAAVNYGAYALCITYWDFARTHLWLAVAIGSVAGLGINFLTSRALFARAGMAVTAEPSHRATPYPNPDFDPHVHIERVLRWQHAGSDGLLRTNYPLTSDSLILDLGGFHGDFSLLMNGKYGALCHCFEVVPELCERIRASAGRNSKIAVHPFGLAGSTRKETLFLAAEGSSTLCDRSSDGKQLVIDLVRASDWFRNELGTRMVDLMKVNIEGGEYELLEHLIDEDLIRQVRNIQVQFHEDVIPDASARMERIHARLAKTHRITFQERFVWENWELMGG